MEMYKLPFILDYTSTFESNYDPPFSEDTGYLLRYLRGYIWQIRALNKLLHLEQTQKCAKEFIIQNIKSMAVVGVRLVAHYFKM